MAIVVRQLDELSTIIVVIEFRPAPGSDITRQIQYYIRRWTKKWLRLTCAHQ